jgi:hypothetical protein
MALEQILVSDFKHVQEELRCPILLLQVAVEQRNSCVAAR